MTTFASEGRGWVVYFWKFFRLIFIQNVKVRGLLRAEKQIISFLKLILALLCN